MVAIEPPWCRPIEAPKLVELSRDDVLKGPDKFWIKHQLSEAMAQQTLGNSVLMVLEHGRIAYLRERRREVQVKSCVNAAFTGQGCGADGILHEHHRTDRTD